MGRKKKNLGFQIDTAPLPSSICPPELAEMIRVVNLLPLDIKIIPFDVALKEEIDKQTKYDLLTLRKFGGGPDILVKDALERMFPNNSPLEVIDIFLSSLPQGFQDYIRYRDSELTRKYPDSDEDIFYRLISKIRSFCDMRDLMFQLVERLEAEGNPNQNPYGQMQWLLFPLRATTRVGRDIMGNLGIDGLPALLGKFDDSRLRKCSVCRQIFWAKRSDSKTCSPRCLNLFNVRNSRKLSAEEKEKRKLQRQANRQIVKNGQAKSVRRKVSQK